MLCLGKRLFLCSLLAKMLENDLGWSHHRCLLWSTCRTTQGQETTQTKVQSTCTYSGEPLSASWEPPSSLDLLQHNCLLNPNPKNSGPLSCSTMPFWAVSEFLLCFCTHGIIALNNCCIQTFPHARRTSRQH